MIIQIKLIWRGALQKIHKMLWEQVEVIKANHLIQAEESLAL